jgi:hypothetical protein
MPHSVSDGRPNPYACWKCVEDYPDYVRVSHERRCATYVCDNIALYCPKDDRRFKIYCKEHIPTGEKWGIARNYKRCNNADEVCTGNVSYRLDWDAPLTLCKKHGLEAGGIPSRRCKKDLCRNEAIITGSDGKSQWCVEHGAEQGHTKIRHGVCEEGVCNISVTYADAVTGKKRWCKQHAALHGGVSTADNKCDCCEKSASFKISMKGRWCKEHKPEGAIRIGDKCAVTNCDNRATHGDQSGTRDTHCTEHAPVGYVHVRRGCTHMLNDIRCPKTAVFGLVKGKPLFCATHHEPIEHHDVRSKFCNYPGGCRTKPWYGHVGGSIDRCMEHREPGMIHSPNVTRKNVGPEPSPACRIVPRIGV